jgi:hypothetical protein
MDRSKQTTLAGFFGKPKPGAAPPRPPSSLSQNASQTQAPPSTTRPVGSTSSQTGLSSTASPTSSTTLKTPSSVVGSSPYPGKEKERKRAGSPLKQSITVDDLDYGSLSPPPEVTRSSPGQKEDEKMDVDNEEAGTRRAKRKVVYAESGSDSEDDVPLVRGAKGQS